MTGHPEVGVISSRLSRSPDLGSINHVQERGRRARHCRSQTTPRLRDSSTYRNHFESAPNFSMRSWNSDLEKTVAEPEGKKRFGATIAIGPGSAGLEVANLHAAGIAAKGNSSAGDVWLAQNRMN
jgi:hypothetical protein